MVKPKRNWIREERRKTLGTTSRPRRGGTHGSPTSPLLQRAAPYGRSSPPAGQSPTPAANASASE